MWAIEKETSRVVGRRTFKKKGRKNCLACCRDPLSTRERLPVRYKLSTVWVASGWKWHLYFFSTRSFNYYFLGNKFYLKKNQCQWTCVRVDRVVNQSVHSRGNRLHASCLLLKRSERSKLIFIRTRLPSWHPQRFRWISPHDLKFLPADSWLDFQRVLLLLFWARFREYQVARSFLFVLYLYISDSRHAMCNTQDIDNHTRRRRQSSLFVTLEKRRSAWLPLFLATWKVSAGLPFSN